MRKSVFDESLCYCAAGTTGSPPPGRKSRNCTSFQTVQNGTVQNSPKQLVIATVASRNARTMKSSLFLKTAVLPHECRQQYAASRPKMAHPEMPEVSDPMSTAGKQVGRFNHGRGGLPARLKRDEQSGMAQQNGKDPTMSPASRPPLSNSALQGRLAPASLVSRGRLVKTDHSFSLFQPFVMRCDNLHDALRACRVCFQEATCVTRITHPSYSAIVWSGRPSVVR